MNFFFLQDFHQKYRFFSSEPLHEITIEFSRLKKIWETAKKKLMLLPQRILKQEQAFERILKIQADRICIFYAGEHSEKRIRKKFYFFLQRQRTKHVLLLIMEVVLLPISGLLALLPGPNIFFGVLALLMITHWKALRGINCLVQKKYEFLSSPSLKKWSLALAHNQKEKYIRILEKIEAEYNLENLQKILYK